MIPCAREAIKPGFGLRELKNDHGRTSADFPVFVMQECYTFMAGLRKCLIIKEAEGVRFELTRPFGLPVFKTGAINRSATPPRFPLKTLLS